MCVCVCVCLLWWTENLFRLYFCPLTTGVNPKTWVGESRGGNGQKDRQFPPTKFRYEWSYWVILSDLILDWFDLVLRNLFNIWAWELSVRERAVFHVTDRILVQSPLGKAPAPVTLTRNKSPINNTQKCAFFFQTCEVLTVKYYYNIVELYRANLYLQVVFPPLV